MVGVKIGILKKENIGSLLFSLILLSLCFIYLLLRIDPKLIYQSQQPVFFFDPDFMIEFLNEPGGLNDLVARYFSQFFYNSWTGTSVLVFIFWLISWITKRLVRSIDISRPLLYLHWIPVVFILALHSDYKFPLVFTLGFLWILIGVYIYIRFSPPKGVQRFFPYLALHTLLYYMAAGQAFIFSIIVIIYEVLYQRRIILPLLYILFAGMLPYIGASTLFIISIRDAYELQLTFYETYKVTWLSWMLYAFFPLVLVLITSERKQATVKGKKKDNLLEKILHLRSKQIQWIRGIVFLAFFIFILLISHDQSKKAFLQIDYYARIGEWEKILEMVKQGRSDRSIVESQAYRALYHTGRLCDELFSYRWHFGGDGLFMHHSLLMLYPRQHSDIFFDLGLINESEHWAYEALSVNGETPWNLQRLVLVNILEKNREVAARYLGMLNKTMWHKAWATEYQKVLSDTGDLLAFPQFNYLKNAMPESDFLVSPVEPELCLEELLTSPGNKMAFEYYMANCLLQGNIGQFIKHLYRFDDFDYSKIPRHFEEAILIYGQLTGQKDVRLMGRKISEETLRKFADFNQILKINDNNIETAYKQLEQKYKDTYWFYALYRYKPKES
jgi:hypothetical protein